MNAHGDFLWYELITPDPEASAKFYGPIFGWTARPPMSDVGGYRVFGLPSADIGGFMPAPAGMQGAPPAWFGYIAVEDVDRTAAKAVELGAAQHVPPTDIPGVGRFAFLADPGGAMFYVMRGASEGTSHAYDPNAVGHCRWNELTAHDPAAIWDFYAALFGWTKGGAMPMGPMGDYQFLDQGGKTFGALMKGAPGAQPGWRQYFGVADIDLACQKIANAGGAVLEGPHEIPGGEFSAHARDPQGGSFGLVGPRRG